MKILTYESPMQSYIKTEWNSGSRLNLKVRNQYLLGNFNWFPLYSAERSFTEMKSAFINLQNESLPKDISQELLVINNSV